MSLSPRHTLRRCNTAHPRCQRTEHATVAPVERRRPELDRRGRPIANYREANSLTGQDAPEPPGALTGNDPQAVHMSNSIPVAKHTAGRRPVLYGNDERLRPEVERPLTACAVDPHCAVAAELENSQMAYIDPAGHSLRLSAAWKQRGY